MAAYPPPHEKEHGEAAVLPVASRWIFSPPPLASIPSTPPRSTMVSYHPPHEKEHGAAATPHQRPAPHFVAAHDHAGFNRQQERIHILKEATGILKPSRMTLLLGPPGCGKTTLLLALVGKLNRNLKVTGQIEYNGVKLQVFVPEKMAAYISQYDLHVPEMTIRETLDFSARFQGIGSRAEIMKEVIRREKEVGITPDPDIYTYMKAISAEGLETSMQIDYIMKFSPQTQKS